MGIQHQAEELEDVSSDPVDHHQRGMSHVDLTRGQKIPHFWSEKHVSSSQTRTVKAKGEGKRL